MNHSPMMQQYQNAKAQCGDALLLFRMGDFYELFYDDARTAAEALGLTLTSREKGENAVAMAGFPHHQLDQYLARLMQQGFRVAVCEQVEDPRQAKGLVRRELTRIVTRGTLTDEALLDPKEPNFLVAIAAELVRQGKPELRYGMAWVDVSTARFEAACVSQRQLLDELSRLRPAECLVSEADHVLAEQLAPHFNVVRCPDWTFAREQALNVLFKHFGTQSMAGFGFDAAQEICCVAAGAALQYLHDTQRTSLDFIDRLVPFHEGSCLQIDHATRWSLELTRTMREGSREGTLIGVLDRTVTPAGARLLLDWLSGPLTDGNRINSRLDAVEEMAADRSWIEQIREDLRGTYDLQRLTSRIAMGRASPRDLECIGATLATLPRIKARLTGRRSTLWGELQEQIDLCGELRAQIEAALVEGCPIQAREGGIIRPGYHAELDRLRDLSRGGKQWIAEYQAQQQALSGIPSLKVGYNQVFGFYLEVTNAHQDKVPPHFIRKQTLKNAERYITAELKQYEEQVLSADEKCKELEYELFCQLRELAHQTAPRLRRTAEALAQIDVLTGLADLTQRQGYTRPILVSEPILEIKQGRHPVLEQALRPGQLVPNDTYLGGASGSVSLVTGPNMAGKSTYIRQVALITIMAQMGSFVPAASAKIGLVDRVFARVGASDELARGMSTFMVEMTETARILNTATDRSLVILDEVGRGTSTYDGLSLAWSIVEYLHDVIGCRTLFATHYHELTQLEAPLAGVRNWNVAVREWEDQVVFLYKIVPGSADRSYGIHVARLAGVPSAVTDRAEEILRELESDEAQSGRKRKRPHARPRRGDIQLWLFEPDEHPLLQEIRTFRVDQTPPLEALHQIQAWQRTLAQEKSSRG